MPYSLVFSFSFQWIIVSLASIRTQAFIVPRTSTAVICVRPQVAPLFRSSGGGDGDSDSSFNHPSDRASTSPHLRAIEEAMEATRTYGATSKEARVAWEIAEEIEDSIFSPCSKRYVKTPGNFAQ